MGELSVTYVTDWTKLSRSQKNNAAKRGEDQKILLLRASRGNMAFLRFAEKSFFSSPRFAASASSLPLCARPAPLKKDPPDLF